MNIDILYKTYHSLKPKAASKIHLDRPLVLLSCLYKGLKQKGADKHLFLIPVFYKVNQCKVHFISHSCFVSSCADILALV